MGEKDPEQFSFPRNKFRCLCSQYSYKIKCLPNKKLGEMDMVVHARTLVAEGRILKGQS